MLPTAIAATRQYATFRVDTLLLGIDVTDVQEVFRFGEITPVPLAPHAVRGLLNLRGQIVIALDLRSALHLPPPQANGTAPMNIVVQGTGGVVTLLVDEIFDVLDVSTDKLSPVPENMPEALKRLLHGVYQLEDGLMLVLNTAEVLEESCL